MRKIILAVLAAILLFSGVAFGQGWNENPRHDRRNFHRNQTCTSWNVIDRITISHGVVHEFVDRNCDRTIDIVQEYVWNGRRWEPTRWWWYR